MMNVENKKVAYFSMEYAIDQSLKIYSGGLGFLAGSHLRSAYDLRKNMIGIGILYTKGYYDQGRNPEGYMEVKFIKKKYSFLKDTGIVFTIIIHGSPVHVKAYLLPSEIFGTAPLYLLTTDIPENDFLSRSISARLYDSNLATKIAQFMLLGIGGAKLLEILNQEPEIYHMNEGHGLPLLFYLYSKVRDVTKVKERVVFTTHTPEKAGNDEISLKLLDEMSFFCGVSLDEIKRVAHIKEETLNFTLTALRMSKIANGVSKIHETVSNAMWGGNEGICKIISITNAQNKKYWMDTVLENCLYKNSNEGLINRKLQLKRELFEVVADQTGKLFDENILTIVWARRVTSYKRADLIVKEFNRFLQLVTRAENQVQIIWAGKTYPEDYAAIDLFNRLISITNGLPRCAVLVGYEMKLSSVLKRGADVWLNTPRYTREASGTSGMTAAMNGAINFSIPDGWVPEFAEHGKNSFIIPVDPTASYAKQDIEDNTNMMNILEREIIPLYYNEKSKWVELMKTGMTGIYPEFDSDRMVKEYYEKLYNH
jgi:glycogen phosphorylase